MIIEAVGMDEVAQGGVQSERGQELPCSRIKQRNSREAGQPGGYEVLELKRREVLQGEGWGRGMEDNVKGTL